MPIEVSKKVARIGAQGDTMIPVIINDVKLVLDYCKKCDINPRISHGGSLKREIATGTGLSFRATVKALTIIRKWDSVQLKKVISKYKDSTK